MRIACALVLCVSLVTVGAAEEAAHDLLLTGKVIDASGAPVSGATVGAYQIQPGPIVREFAARCVAQQETGDDGAFSLRFQVSEGMRVGGTVLARKEGHASSWHSWRANGTGPFQLVLRKPAEFRGKVTDPEGNPVGGATVRALVSIGSGPARFTFGIPGLDWWVTESAPDGTFKFADLPPETKVGCLVSAPGCATVAPVDAQGHPGMQFVAGGDVATIVLQPEARIEGIVVEKGTDQPIAGVSLIATRVGPMPALDAQAATSGPDGRFVIGGLKGGPVVLRLASPDLLNEWEWVAEEVPVTPEPGATVHNARVVVSKGAVLKVRVTDGSTGKPVGGAVLAMPVADGKAVFGRSDAEGLASLRVLPGTYSMVVASRIGYRRQVDRLDGLEVAEGKSYERSIALDPVWKVRGVAVDPEGEPVAGASVWLLMHGSVEPTQTDATGAFEVGLSPEMARFEEPPMQQALVIQHIERGLAGSADVNSTDKPLRVQLSPGVRITGKVVGENGQPVRNAEVAVAMRALMWVATIGKSFFKTDADGQYETSPLPAGRLYMVGASAEALGRSVGDCHIPDEHTGTIEAPVLVLPPANLSISGSVVDEQGDPVADAQVEAEGRGQPARTVTTDQMGRFVLPSIVDGEVKLTAFLPTQRGYRTGRTTTKGGASGVVIVVDR
jgi:protocatechuate 3,4-dioxygenase beta subunit